jgi:hypothetical protein
MLHPVLHLEPCGGGYVWSGTWDSNPRLQPWQGSGLAPDQPKYAQLQGGRDRLRSQSVPIRLRMLHPVLLSVLHFGGAR